MFRSEGYKFVLVVVVNRNTHTFPRRLSAGGTKSLCQLISPTILIPLLNKYTCLIFVRTHIFFLHFENEDHIGTSPAVDLKRAIKVSVQSPLSLKIPSTIFLTNGCIDFFFLRQIRVISLYHSAAATISPSFLSQWKNWLAPFPQLSLPMPLASCLFASSGISCHLLPHLHFIC